MTPIHLILLVILPVLCVLLPPPARTKTRPSISADKPSTLLYTLETKEKVVQFFQPITIRVTHRRHNQRISPTDLWVVDVASTHARRVTSPRKGRIVNFDWLDDHTLIFDRQEESDNIRLAPRSSLRRISLATTKWNSRV